MFSLIELIKMYREANEGEIDRMLNRLLDEVIKYIEKQEEYKEVAKAAMRNGLPDKYTDKSDWDRWQRTVMGWDE